MIQTDVIMIMTNYVKGRSVTVIVGDCIIKKAKGKGGSYLLRIISWCKDR